MWSGNLIGRQIQDFIIEEFIGQGGMARVYRAHQVSINRDVAVKLIAIDPLTQDTAFTRRFAHEAAMIASLEHIHVLPIYAYGIENDVAYIVMRLLRGGSLSDLISDGPLPLERAVELFNQFSQGLAYAHSKNVIHRDLKPSNIMMDDTGNAYLTDFGLAKLITGGVDLTKTGNIVGTPAYMSPEQLRGETLDQRSDIYSMGIILYHMLTGSPPFEATGNDVISVIYKQLEDDPERPSLRNPEVSPAVEAVVLRALSKNPDDRFESIVNMARALKAAAGISTSTGDYPRITPPTVQHQPETVETPKRHDNRIVLIGGMVIIVAILLGLSLIWGVIQENSADQNATATAIALESTQSAMPLTPSPPQVLTGESARAADITITDAEVQRARQRAGPDGFIAYIACNQTSEYHAAQSREIRDFFSDYEIPARVYDSNTDEYLQITLIERARTDGATGLVVCAVNNAVLDESLTSVQKAGIPLVLLNPGEKSYGGVLLVGDNFLMGQQAGRLAGEIIRDEMGGQADVVILDFPELPIIVERANGLEAGLHEFAPDANVIGRYKGGTREFGKASVNSLLTDGVTFQAILSINDAGSFGAIEALEDAELDPTSVFIVSVDAEALAQRYIRDGHYLRGSIEVGRTEFSKAAADAMIKLLAGAPIAELILVPPGDVLTRALLEQRAG